MKLKDGRELTLRKAEKDDAADILAYLNQWAAKATICYLEKTGCSCRWKRKRNLLNR